MPQVDRAGVGVLCLVEIIAVILKVAQEFVEDADVGSAKAVLAAAVDKIPLMRDLGFGAHAGHQDHQRCNKCLGTFRSHDIPLNPPTACRTSNPAS